MSKSLLFYLAVVLALLTGCGGSASGAFSTDTPPGSQGPEPVIENAFWSVDNREETLTISTNGRTVSGSGAVTSKYSIGPNDGYFYIELITINADNFFRFGFALHEDEGRDVTDFSSETSEAQNYGVSVDSSNQRVGIAIDYRGSSPVIYFIESDQDGVQSSIRSTIRDDWHQKQIVVAFRTENTNSEFTIVTERVDTSLDFETLLSNLNLDAHIGVTPGWPSDDLRPTITINESALVVMNGEEITVTASSDDEEDGSINENIQWLLDGELVETGPSVAVTTTPGSHKLSARVVDSLGQESVTKDRYFHVISDETADSDLDTLSFSEELALGTNPGKRDTDEDGIPDAEESIHGTNPLLADTDDDNMSDGYEVMNGLDPLNNDASIDSDGDGFNNIDEFNDDRRADRAGDFPGIANIEFSTLVGDVTESNLSFEMRSTGENIARGSIAASPGSGWHYFEGVRLVAPGNYGFGITTINSSFENGVGSDDQSASISSLGDIRYDGNTVASFDTPADEIDTYGIAIDYSGLNPVLYILLSPFQDDYEVLEPVVLAGITESIYIAIYGESQGETPQQMVNVGGNKLSTPFRMSPRYLLTHAGINSAVTMPEGWGSDFEYEPLEQPKIEDDVFLVKNDRVHPGVYLSEDKLSASYMVGAKMAILANQGMYGNFWYWEAERLLGTENYGFGFNNPHTFLMPYCCVNTSLEEVGPSTSINALGGIWRNLLFQQPLPFSSEDQTHYGFAVDYRGSYPIVYPIANDEVLTELHLTDFLTTPIYPMIYGNVQGPVATNRANFGALPFVNDATQALTDYGVDTSEFREGWGVYTQLQ